MSELIAELPKRIRAKRAEHDLSLYEMSELCGLSVDAIHKYERGSMTPNATSLLKLAKALNTDPNYLLGWDEKEK